MNTAASDLPRKNELDIARGVCALSVVACHTQLPIKYTTDASKLIFDTFANGPAAVVVFFLISGFCIHYPYSNGRRVDPLHFLTKRFIRIGTPLLVATILAYATGAESGLELVAWSLYAEIIYYCMYPFLNLLHKTLSWKVILPASVAISVFVIFSFDNKGDFPSYGPALTWIVGYPIWISGCILAEMCNNTKPAPSPIPMRILLILSSMIIVMLRKVFGSISGSFPFLLLIFGGISFFWLQSELKSVSKRQLPKVLNQACRFSYSLYLTHIIVLHLGWCLQMDLQIPQLPFRLSQISASILFSAIFYYLIERPSHKYAHTLTQQAAVQSKSNLSDFFTNNTE